MRRGRVGDCVGILRYSWYGEEHDGLLEVPENTMGIFFCEVHNVHR